MGKSRRASSRIRRSRRARFARGERARARSRAHDCAVQTKSRRHYHMNMSMKEPALATALACLSGFVDVVCLMRFHCFAALQTGNMVKMGMLLADTSVSTFVESAAFLTSLILANMLGVFALCWIADHCSKPLVVAAPILGALTVLAGLVDGLIIGGCKWAACLLSASFGAMNFASSPNTVLTGRLFTMVSLATGNLQKCTNMLYRFTKGQRLSKDELHSMSIAVGVVGGTLLGALLGGVVFACGFRVEQMLCAAAVAQTTVLLLHDIVLRPQETRVPALAEPLVP